MLIFLGTEKEINEMNVAKYFRALLAVNRPIIIYVTNLIIMSTIMHITLFVNKCTNFFSFSHKSNKTKLNCIILQCKLN